MECLAAFALNVVVVNSGACRSFTLGTKITTGGAALAILSLIALAPATSAEYPMRPYEAVEAAVVVDLLWGQR